MENQQRACPLFPQDPRHEDPMMTDPLNVGITTIVAETKNLPEATGMTTGDVVVAVLWVEVVEEVEVEVEVMMTDAMEEDLIVKVEEDTIVMALPEMEIVEVLIEGAVTTTIEIVSIISIEEVATEVDMIITVIVVRADLIHFEEVVTTEEQQLAIAEICLHRKPEVRLAVA